MALLAGGGEGGRESSGGRSCGGSSGLVPQRARAVAGREAAGEVGGNTGPGHRRPLTPHRWVLGRGKAPHVQSKTCFKQ